MDRGKIIYISQLPHEEQVISEALNEEKPFAIAQLSSRFGVNDILTGTKDTPFMASLLYYFGVLTFDGYTLNGELILKIPNLVMRKLCVGPIVSMAPFVIQQHRVLFGIGWALGIAIVLILGTIARDKLYKIGLAGILLAILAASLFTQSWKMRSTHLFNVDNHFATEGRFLWQGDQKQALFLTPDYQTFYIHLSWLKKQILGENAPKLIFDEIDLLGLETDALHLFRYDPSCECIREISDQIPHLIAAGKARLQNKPLSVNFSYQQGYFKWQFGPYQTGVYSLIEYPFFGKIPLPPSKEMLWCQLNSLSFRIRYDSPEGWTTYSPLFELSEGKRVVWER